MPGKGHQGAGVGFVAVAGIVVPGEGAVRAGIHRHRQRRVGDFTGILLYGIGQQDRAGTEKQGDLIQRRVNLHPFPARVTFSCFPGIPIIARRKIHGFRIVRRFDFLGVRQIFHGPGHGLDQQGISQQQFIVYRPQVSVLREHEGGHPRHGHPLPAVLGG